MLRVSLSTVARRIREYGLANLLPYSTISDEDLDGVVRDVQALFPNIGYRRPITEQQLDDMAVYCTTDEEENIFLEYFNYALESLNLHRPTNWREALTLFQRFMQVSQ